jgi:hypothetical protein
VPAQSRTATQMGKLQQYRQRCHRC